VSLKADSDIQPPNAWNQADQARRGLQTPRANQLPNISTDPDITQSTTQSSAASSTQSTHNPPPTSSSANNPESTPPCLSGKLLHSHDWDIAVPSTGAVLKPLHERQAPPPSFLQTVQSHPAHPPVAINASPLSALGLGATETGPSRSLRCMPSITHLQIR
jgi:hypothetical protein